MEYTLLILLLLIMIWINLRNKISKSQEKTEELSKEIAALRRRLENSSEVADEIKEPEPETLKEPEVFIQPEPVKAIVEPARNLQPQKVRKPVNYEKYIGENLFGKIGILILVLGMGLFVKYAIDKEWINETLRTILGFGMGGLLLFVAWRLKDSYRTFSSLLSAAASCARSSTRAPEQPRPIWPTSCPTSITPSPPRWGCWFCCWRSTGGWGC